MAFKPMRKEGGHYVAAMFDCECIANDMEMCFVLIDPFKAFSSRKTKA